MQLAVVLCAVFAIGLCVGGIIGWIAHKAVTDLDRLHDDRDQADHGATIIDFPDRGQPA